jgi:23S rRNA (pseudouridine1915-N3)-methyltransferase
MWLHLACVGKLKAGPEKLLADDYASRTNQLGRQVGIRGIRTHESSESQLNTTQLRVNEEFQQLWSVKPDAATVIALDERGKIVSTQNFMQLLSKPLTNGKTDLVFMIGGPDGHAEETRQKADHTIALGAMTWPHRLVRIMLLEQIYRAVTIMVNHPYHRP